MRSWSSFPRSSCSSRCSVVEFFQGYLGQPVGGFPEPLRTKIIRDQKRIDGRPGADMKPYDFTGAKKSESLRTWPARPLTLEC